LKNALTPFPSSVFYNHTSIAAFISILTHISRIQTATELVSHTRVKLFLIGQICFMLGMISSRRGLNHKTHQRLRERVDFADPRPHARGVIDYWPLREDWVKNWPLQEGSLEETHSYGMPRIRATAAGPSLPSGIAQLKEALAQPVRDSTTRDVTVSEEARAPETAVIASPIDDQWKACEAPQELQRVPPGTSTGMTNIIMNSVQRLRTQIQEDQNQTRIEAEEATRQHVEMERLRTSAAALLGGIASSRVS
jgi:hypothetical protein